MAASRERMLANAFIIIDEVERHGDLEGMTLGGGTSMMLQINHRVSRDIDFFLPDPQLVGFISVAAADVEAWLSGFGYRGDGRLFMKVDIGEGGQIDFIAAPPVTDHEPLERTIHGRDLLLDAVPAIIASKVCHRCHRLMARDIFDIAAACEAGYLTAVLDALGAMPDKVAGALDGLDRLRPGQLAAVLSRQDIRPGFGHLLNDTPAIARKVLALPSRSAPRSEWGCKERFRHTVGQSVHTRKMGVRAQRRRRLRSSAPPGNGIPKPANRGRPAAAKPSVRSLNLPQPLRLTTPECRIRDHVHCRPSASSMAV